ncbi:MAG: ABC transporter permease [Lactobacillales bacterium]|jgi:ABC-2 type transport system permease protein|nr:ABC transporter permease [Lactobacillales bacterium]
MTFKFPELNYIRAKAVFKKEFKHILRDPFTLTMALLLPLLIVVILGYSIEFNIKEIKTAYTNHDKTIASRKLIETFGSSAYFKTFPVESPMEGYRDIISERARAAIFIPPQFEKELRAGRTGNVQILLDGADNSSISAISNYLTTINLTAIFKILDIPPVIDTPVQFKARYLFNPELNSKWFAIPGISAVIIAIVAIMLTALTICREWEKGSMEMLLSTPLTSLEIIIGKILPYAILSFAGFIIVFLAARFIFSVPFVGNYLTLMLGTLLFILAYLAIGLYISIVTKQQQVAVQYAMIVGMLPTSMLSGFIFPIEYMPNIYQWFSTIFPARWYVEISRDQFLKASNIEDLWLPLVILAVQGIVATTACLFRFKRNLE